jgi:hypothetical protein
MWIHIPATHIILSSIYCFCKRSPIIYPRDVGMKMGTQRKNRRRIMVHFHFISFHSFTQTNGNLRRDRTYIHIILYNTVRERERVSCRPVCTLTVRLPTHSASSAATGNLPQLSLCCVCLSFVF